MNTKKYRSLFLIALLVSLTYSLPAAAQEKTSALEAYAKWRAKALERLPSGIATPHYSISVVSQRRDSTSAQLDFVVVGQMSGYIIETQPVNLQMMSDGQENKTEAGELSKSQFKKPVGMNEANPNPIHEATILIPVSSSANAIELKWNPEGVGEMSYTLLLPLEDKPSANVFGVVPSCSPKTASTASSFKNARFDLNATCNCLVASGYTARCGYIVACCFTPCARFDYVNCTVTCCTKCPRGDCCDGILPP